MINGITTDLKEVLRQIPSVDQVLRTPTARAVTSEAGPRHTTFLARVVIDQLRADWTDYVKTSEWVDVSREGFLEDAEIRLTDLWQIEKQSSLQRVINATGVIIHTNLGRAPLSESAIRAVAERAGRYCNVEYDLETGKRGKRGARAENLLANLTGAESALIVNNCAAAAVLVLTALGQGGEAIISRGEMVEIGGDFRIPDVMTQSGASLVEVGTTNRTKLSDYERALTESTKLIVKVHPSNYRIIGFTSTPQLAELAAFAHQNNLLLYEDAGSGALIDLSPYGLADEPIIGHSVAAGADVVTFSGDKLLGGCQAGLIVGRHDVIEKLRRHPLYRALRADKLVYAVLEATLESYLRESAIDEIPVLRMLATSVEELKKRTTDFARRLAERCESIQLEIVEGHSVIGGGAAPAVQPSTVLLALKHKTLSADRLELKLRSSDRPVITRIVDDRVVIDLRTVFDDEEERLLEMLARPLIFVT